MGSSYHMEKEGLVRAISFMESNNLSIDLLVMERHRQIDKWLRTEKPAITQKYDI